MKKKLTNNLGMRILAVVIAILIWIIVVNVSDPIIESTYSGIPVEIINADTITKQNKTYDILNDTDSISVTLSAKRSISDLLGRDNIKATADLANLDMEKGTVRIKLETNKYNDKIESIKAKNDILEVSIENLMRKQFAITSQVNGEPSDGYVIGDTVLDQNVVTVQGPESIVSQIDKAVVEASVAGMSTSISTTSTIRYYDADGNQLDSARLSGNISSVNLKVDVLATKMLGFRFNTTGELDPDYAIAGDITSDIDEVLVAGKSSIVTNTSAIAIPASAIDIEGKRETFSLTIDVTKYLPDTLKLIDEDFDGKITVTVPIEKMQSKEVEVAKSNITISGYDEDTQTVALVGTGINVGIKGLAADIQDMKKNAIKGEIDVASYMEDNNLTELKPGVYNFPVQLTLPDGIQTVRETYTAECRVKNID
ncbi:MAG: CdaR family protein [Lachnospiraceae bacterium]|nr:CdaR family protein [Lachnospiraceae bacterium]MDD5853208.1 CdaR family protein [Lachnospiraceae bacterium]